MSETYAVDEISSVLKDTDHGSEKCLQLTHSGQGFDFQGLSRSIGEQLLFVLIVKLKAKALGEDLQAVIRRCIVQIQRKLFDRFQDGDELADESEERLRLIVGQKYRAEQFGSFAGQMDFVGRRSMRMLMEQVLKDSQETAHKPGGR